MITFSWFKKNDGRTFQSPPPPPRIRTLGKFTGTVNEQETSIFFQLPAEVRNQIYEYVFGPYIQTTWDGTKLISEASKTARTTTLAQPLSLLLTCRKASLEATLLAFQIHPFRVSGVSVFHTFRKRVEILPPPLFGAITYLSHAVYRPIRFEDNSLSDFMSHSILLFPTVKRLDIMTEIHFGDRTSNHLDIADCADMDIRSDAIKRYIPLWFHDSLMQIVNGYSFSWQSGQKWRFEYGLFSAEAFMISDWQNPLSKEVIKRGTVSREFMSKDKSLEACLCGCGEAVWVTATLVQETGRRVDVRVVFETTKGPPKHEVSLMSSTHRLRLNPYADPLPVQVVGGGSGIQWHGGEEFRMGSRTRNVGMRAKIQSYWKGRGA